MFLNNNIIEEAFSFYDIKNEEYKNKCIEAYNLICNDNNLLKKVNNIYDILFKLNDENKILEIKKEDYYTLFENDNPFISNVIILLSYKLHEENIKNNFDEKMIKIHKKRLKQILESNSNGMRITQLIWASHFIKTNMIEKGSLQFQLTTIDPLTKEKNNCVKVHIPKAAKLDSESMGNSICNIEEEIEKYFKKEDLTIYCESWLLSYELRGILNKDSNILRFQDLFDIRMQKESKKDFLKYVFGIYEKDFNDYESLPENTSLQAALKNMLIEDKKLHIGVGVLKKKI